jgi:hypothetical protein
VASKVDGDVRSAIERVARTLGELGHEVVRADPPYGLVGPALVPRGSAGVRVWCKRVPDRSVLEPRTGVASRVGRALSGWTDRAGGRRARLRAPCEATLLALGAQLEASDGWADRRPELS